MNEVARKSVREVKQRRKHCCPVREKLTRVECSCVEFSFRARGGEGFRYEKTMLKSMPMNMVVISYKENGGRRTVIRMRCALKTNQDEEKIRTMTPHAVTVLEFPKYRVSKQLP